MSCGGVVVDPDSTGGEKRPARTQRPGQVSFGVRVMGKEDARYDLPMIVHLDTRSFAAARASGEWESGPRECEFGNAQSRWRTLSDFGLRLFNVTKYQTLPPLLHIIPCPLLPPSPPPLTHPYVPVPYRQRWPCYLLIQHRMRSASDRLERNQLGTDQSFLVPFPRHPCVLTNNSVIFPFDGWWWLCVTTSLVVSRLLRTPSFTAKRSNQRPRLNGRIKKPVIASRALGCAFSANLPTDAKS